MKTDRELLELAAKAAGYTVTAWVEDLNGVDRFQVYSSQSMWMEWNPLENDDEAFRLSGHLFQSVQYIVDTWPDNDAGMMRSKANIPATRRAIVRAAAAIGEAMQ